MIFITGKVRQFNGDMRLPDVLEGGRVAPLHSFVSNEVGFR